MEIKVKLKYLRMAPRKVRLIAGLIRGKSVPEAQNILSFSVQKASLLLNKLLKSAIASAKNNSGLEETDLYISKITVDEGPKIKRWQPRSRGQAFEIHRRTSHVTLVLSEIKGKTKKVKSKKIKPGVPEKIEETKRSDERKKESPKFRPRKEFKKPETKKVASRIFRRKAF